MEKMSCLVTCGMPNGLAFSELGNLQLLTRHHFLLIIFVNLHTNFYQLNVFI